MWNMDVPSRQLKTSKAKKILKIPCLQGPLPSVPKTNFAHKTNKAQQDMFCRQNLLKTLQSRLVC